MRTTMQRTITISEVHYATTEVINGDVKIITHEPITITGKVTQKNATRFIPLAKGVTPIVTKISYTENTYSLDIQKFTEVAELVESNSVELDESEED